MLGSLKLLQAFIQRTLTVICIYCDLHMLEKKEELRGAFFNEETNQHKLIDAIRVDGASDEGPSHDEVRCTLP